MQQLPLPLADLDGMDGVISGDLLDRLTTAVRLHGDSRFELGGCGCGVCSLVGDPIMGGTPPQRLTMGHVQKNQSTSMLLFFSAAKSAFFKSLSRDGDDVFL